MNQSGAIQLTFSGGMIEGIKQDQPFEISGGNLQSVLWLENYSHVLQQDSAVKRWGEVDSGVPFLDLAYYSHFLTNDYVFNAGSMFERDRASWLQGVQLYDVVHPKGSDGWNTNYTCFVGRYVSLDQNESDYAPDSIVLGGVLTDSVPAVAVVSYASRKNGAAPEWQEVFRDDNTQPFIGWYTFGTLGDVARYGETLLFTTTLDQYFDDQGTPNSANNYLYPVYRYLYWDITKKWKDDNQFMNGIGTFADVELSKPSNASKYAKWKVLSPPQSIINDSNIGIIQGYVSTQESTLPDGTIAPKFDISISFQDCPALAYKTQYDGAHNVVISHYQPSWLKESTFYNSGAGWTGDDVYLPSSQTLSIERIDIKGFDELFYGKSVNEVIKVPGLYNPIDSTLVTATLTNNLPVTKGSEHFTPDVLLGEIAAQPDYRYAIGNTLVNYTDGSPRLWLPGEKMRVVLTANFNGVEALMFTGEFTSHYPLETSYSTLGVRYLYTPPFYPMHDTYASQYTATVVVSGSSSEKTLEGIGTTLTQFTKMPGTTDEFCYASFLYFTIGVSVDFMDKLIDSGCSSLSLWASKPDSNNHILRSLGFSMDTPSGNVYNKPVSFTEDTPDYTKMALLKKFVIDGKTEQVDTYKDWLPRPFATNAWNIRTDPTGFQEYIAVPLPAKDETLLIATPILPTSAYVESYLDDPANNNYWGAGAPYWTPDFVVWDYPTETTLFLNSSGKYWKGLGARLITVIKGRTFIGGCIGADGIEEQAILRYSDVQGGAISPDIFSKERVLQIGHQPHTALLEFREQLWAFSRYQFYRIGLASITQEETWEFFDVVEQGTFNQKSVVVTPYGVCFMNEAGVWITDGGEPQNLVLAILPTYQSCLTGKSYLYTTINQLPGTPYLENGINIYAELNYDGFNDELLIYSPLFAVENNDENNADVKPVSDFTMIFNFKYKTWRIESSKVPDYTVQITT